MTQHAEASQAGSGPCSSRVVVTQFSRQATHGVLQVEGGGDGDGVRGGAEDGETKEGGDGGGHGRGHRVVGH